MVLMLYPDRYTTIDMSEKRIDVVYGRKEKSTTDSTWVKLYGGKSNQRITFDNHIMLRFNSEFYSPNPSVFMVIDVLRNIHIDTVTRMNQYHKGIQNIIRPIEKQKQEYLFQFWEVFLRDGDRMQFLKNVGSRFQPIKL
ncbi:uncharacterized protein LOC112590993 [Melanaphis sacchari]|uniref:uncharacterized protein LOC112590993 n=1 Tax=Melanaphis sacchari TaxID=742174 RepID=UPI000DC13947|nr:uncharacterized protein LOC112590993 [Melanaphis sacchari]